MLAVPLRMTVLAPTLVTARVPVVFLIGPECVLDPLVVPMVRVGVPAPVALSIVPALVPKPLTEQLNPPRSSVAPEETARLPLPEPLGMTLAAPC